MSTSALAFPPASQMDILFTATDIADRVAEIGRQITADYEGQSTGHPLVLIGVLKGAAIFLSDLARAIQISPETDYERCTLTLQWHEDIWYTDAYGQTPASFWQDPGQRTTNRLPPIKLF